MPQDERTTVEKRQGFLGDTRTPEELDEFKVMLTRVNILYLGMPVLILLDLSYLSRFWTCATEADPSWTARAVKCPSGAVLCFTEWGRVVLWLCRSRRQFEAWLSLQVVTREGLQATSESTRRCTIRPIYNANTLIANALTGMWQHVNSQQAFDRLRQPE